MKARACRAFSLIELMTVIGVVGILGGLIGPGVARARTKAGAAQCLAHHHQFGVAMALYTADHHETFPPNRDGREVPLGETWVQGWLGVPGPDCEDLEHLRRSLLGTYLANPALWRCPAQGPVTVAGIRQLRVRTVSLNGFVGSPIRSPAASTYLRTADLIQLSPAECLTFIEERADTINDGTFALQWDFDTDRPELARLRDKPAMIHASSGNLTFADGHAETRRWRHMPTSLESRDDVPAAGNPDLKWLQEHATSRVPAGTPRQKDGL